MKALLLSSSFPYPVDVGRKVIMAGFIEYLISVLGAENVTFAYMESGADGESPIRAPCGVSLLSLEGLPKRLAGVAWQGLIKKRRAFQEMMLRSRTAFREVQSLLQQISPDLVVVDTVRMAQYVESLSPKPYRSILYLDDLYSLRYRRMIGAMRAYPEAVLDPFGTFGRFIPPAMREMMRGQALQQRLLSLESHLLERREKELPYRFDSVLLLNADESRSLAMRSKANNITTVKPFLAGHRNRLPRRFTGEPTYLFLGNLRYPANAFSLAVFLAQALPALLRTDPRTKLIVVGRGADPRLKELGSESGGHIEFRDYVEDLAPLMSKAAAMVVPLVYGSGLKMKVLDGLYYGIPIVSTPWGIEGVPAAHGSECFIVDDVSGFVEPLLDLRDVDLNTRMSQRGQELYAKEFAPEVVWDQYGQIFGTRERFSRVDAMPEQRMQA